MVNADKSPISIEQASNIIGIQFSLLSPDEIRNTSVANISQRDTYIGNKPVINGLFDPRMGTLEPGFICPTDGLDHMQCPGYFGHIELARPLFYMHYLHNIIKILRCVCFRCSKLLISKKELAYVMDLPPDKRWATVFSLASKVKKCGAETEDGCGFVQAKRIKKEGLATLNATWEKMSEDADDLQVTLTPEICLRILSRISDDDIRFMGFSPQWSRPEWMICQVLAVPPPAVRPSVKHDSQQRSEDDLTHIIVNIIKTNKALQEKIDNGAQGNIINDWTTLLQYYVATLVDNKMSGVAAFAQRSGRPLKSIKDRMNGKQGRVRGNLMGKRVDYSARSVITPDPNLSIRELGVPMKIAMNLTFPVQVNHRNKSFLATLVRNGPKKYPGAKILERSGGEKMYLEHVDRDSIELEIGDVVHRQMMDGDPVLFNRQPTLHRMSMMCHIARIMPVGDTFRMNVGDTKPYNADFDGDEMNMHMPQDQISCAELVNLAAVPWQMISPANNKSIVGIFQDSLLGSYLITRKDISFNRMAAMDLLMDYKHVDVQKLRNINLSSFEVLSQIIPPISLRYKNKQFVEGEEEETSNNILEIRDGEYRRGQLDKAALGDGTKGLIHRICNDIGNEQSASFVDDIQNIVTKYMKQTAYSVGISDLIANAKTNGEISSIIASKKNDVQQLIDETHLGIFENKSGLTNQTEFENQVNDILGQALSQAGRVGLTSLSADNRFVTMVKAGSKGSDINISQMISCLGQQQVDGKRVPYGFDERTLPHFTKYDDSPSARGFVENSFIGGLTPEELFFHAMGGRVGLIDTAVKTSSTGYIQRRLIKGLEDLKVAYDMTVRNNKNKIIQFRYGDDGFDTVSVENQILPLTTMSMDSVYAQFVLSLDNDSRKVYSQTFTKNAYRRLKAQQEKLTSLSKALVDEIVAARKELNKCVFNEKADSRVHLPVAFKYIISNISGQLQINRNSLVDITPLELLKKLDETYGILSSMKNMAPTKLFKLTYNYYLSPVNLLLVNRFGKQAVELLLTQIVTQYKRSIVAPGEMVGIIAAQSIGEPTTQMTLNTFHFAGVASKSNVTRGVPRIEEILSLSEKPKNPSCTVFLLDEAEEDQAQALKTMHRLEHTRLRSLVKVVQIIYDPDPANTRVKDDAELVGRYLEFEKLINGCSDVEPEQVNEDLQSRWMMRLEMNVESMLDKDITMEDINFAITRGYGDSVSCVYSDYNDDNLVFRLRFNKKKPVSVNPLDQSDEVYLLRSMQNELLDNLVIRGVEKITNVNLRKMLNVVKEENGSFVEKDLWVVDTVGTNLLDILGLDFINPNKTFTNDIQEIYRVLGIEAARQAIFNEISEVIEFDNTYINYHHLSLLCDRMTCNEKMVSIFRHGLNSDNVGPIAKASFEETPQMFMKAAQHGELDPVTGISANVMCGQEGQFGTASFTTLLDCEAYSEIASEKIDEEEATIDESFDGIETVSKEQCAKSVLATPMNLDSLQGHSNGMVETDYDPGF